MNTIPTFKSAITKTSLFVLVLWLIKTSEQLFHLKLQFLGVYPGELTGLIGVLTAPLIHGSYEHLFSNTLPTLILGTVLFYGYPKSSKWVIPLVWIGSGIGVWLFARESYHVGASGLTHGIFFYLLITSILRRDKRSIALMMIAFFMYGSMVLTILPREQQISFEYHLFGALFGVLSAAIFYKWDPKLERKKYDWENENEPDAPPQAIEEDEADLIGDAWKLDNQVYDDTKSYNEYRH